MLKNLLALIALSIAVILTMTHIQIILSALIAAHDWVSNTLKDVFSGGPAGNLTRELLALLCIPMLAALIPAGFYWLAKRGWFPYFMQVAWVIWLIQTTALIALYKIPTA